MVGGISGKGHFSQTPQNFRGLPAKSAQAPQRKAKDRRDNEKTPNPRERVLVCKEAASSEVKQNTTGQATQMTGTAEVGRKVGEGTVSQRWLQREGRVGRSAGSLTQVPQGLLPAGSRDGL